MELDETVRQGAARETTEETGASFDLEDLVSVVSVPSVGLVQLFYRARLLNGVFAPGPESLEVRLFDAKEVPWEDVALLSVERTLRCYFEDRRTGRLSVRTIDVLSGSSDAELAHS